MRHYHDNHLQPCNAMTRNIYYLLVALMIGPLMSYGQSAVQTAAKLHQLHQGVMKPLVQKEVEADTVLERSRRFFQLLAAGSSKLRENSSPTVAEVRNAYLDNSFLTVTVGEVYRRFTEASVVKSSQQAELDAGVIQKKVAAAQAQEKLLGRIGQLLVAQLAADTSEDGRADANRTLLFTQLYKAATQRLTAPTLVDSIEQVQVRLTAAVYQQLNKFYADAANRIAPDIIGAADGPLRAALWSYLRVPAPGAGDNSSREMLQQAYEAMRARYNELMAAQGHRRSVAAALNEVQRIKQELQAEPLAPSLGLAPVISLPTPTAALAGGKTAAPAAVSAEGAIIDGTARFLADRLKQELNATFFQHFATLLHDSAYVELQWLFPSTARLLSSGAADYSTVVQTLRGTFERDLRDLLFNYGTLLENQKFYTRRLGLGQEAQRLLHFTYASSRALYYLTHGAHPADLLSRLQQDLTRNELLAGNAPLEQTLSLAAALSGALLDGNTLGPHWLPTRQVDSLLRAPATRGLLLGLLLERVKQMKLSANANKWLLDPATFKPLVLDFIVLSGQLESQTRALQVRAAQARLRAADFAPLCQTMLTSLEWAARRSNALLVQMHDPQGVDEQQLQVRLALYRGIGDALLQGFVAADGGDYGVALSNLLDVVLLSLGQEKAPAGGGNNEARLDATARLSQLPQPARTQLLSLPQLVRYGSFMAAVAQARSADDVKEALEAAALPVGSSSIKRRSFSSISINAFAGATTGAEYAYLTEAQRVAGLPNVNSWRYNLGPTAPIGLSWAWGLRGAAMPVRRRALLAPASWWLPSTRQRLRIARNRRLDQAYRYYDINGEEKYLRGTAAGLFVSVIDLGVPVLLRFNDPHAAPLPNNIGFRQVLAPGLFGFYHLRGAPLSLFAGAQFTPQLRELRQLTPDSTRGNRAFSNLDPRNSIRFNVGLTVDIPLFQLYTRNSPRGLSPRRADVERVADRNARELVALREVAALGNGSSVPVLLSGQITTLRASLKADLAKPENRELNANLSFQSQVDHILTSAQQAADRHDWAGVAQARAKLETALQQAKAAAAASRKKNTEAQRGAVVPPLAPKAPAFAPLNLDIRELVPSQP